MLIFHGGIVKRPLERGPIVSNLVLEKSISISKIIYFYLWFCFEAMQSDCMIFLDFDIIIVIVFFYKSFFHMSSTNYQSLSISAYVDLDRQQLMPNRHEHHFFFVFRNSCVLSKEGALFKGHSFAFKFLKGIH